MSTGKSNSNVNSSTNKLKLFMSRNFKEYPVWQRARELNKDIYSLNLPYAEKKGLIDQIQRASVSISSNIAEGCGRSSNVEFARFLEIALGSAFEVERQLILCYDLGYITEDVLNYVELKVTEIQKQLTGLIKAVKTV